MRYEVAPIGCRPWLLNGLSDRLIVNHYENEYGGTVRRLNAVTAALESLDVTTAQDFQLAGLKRDELAASNSKVLHDLYFASLGGDGKPTGRIRGALVESFGTVDRWRAEFTAMARSLAGGAGWVVLAHRGRERRLVNQLALDDAQGFAAATPLLALDLYEHAYHADFGANVAAYVEAFLRNADWARVELRFLAAAGEREPGTGMSPQETDVPAISAEEVRRMMETGNAVQVVDARPRHYHARERSTVDGATWRDPDRIPEWAGQLSKASPVVVYCCYGFHVGCNVTEALRKEGFDARFLAGGLSAWKAMVGMSGSGASPASAAA